MKAKYSLVHVTNAACPPPETIRVAAAAGYDCVSLGGIPNRTPHTETTHFSFADDPALLAETKRAAADEGICIRDVEDVHIVDGVAISDYEKDLAVAAELGIQHVVTSIWAKDAAFSEEAFCELCEMAESYGMCVDLAFVTWSSIRGISDAAWFLEKTRKNNQGILLDTLHFYHSKNVIRDVVGLPKDWFRNVRLSDCPRALPETREEMIRTASEERLFPGEGGIDLKRLIAQTPDAVRGIAVPNPTRMKEMGYEAYAKKALEATKQLFHEG